MGFASIGGAGTASEYNFSKYTLELVPSTNCDAGDFCVIVVAWTSHYFFGPDERQTTECSVTDDAGNRWVTIASQYLGGVYTAAFACQLRNDLLTSNTVTIKHYGPGAKAATLHRFSLDAGMRWAFEADNLGQTVTTASDPNPCGPTGLNASVEYLLIHTLSAQSSPNTTTYTWDSDYTQFAGAGTSGHADDVHVRGGYRIVSGITSDLVDVSSSHAESCAQYVVPIRQIEPDEDFSDFPNTPLIDDFNRANEDPADGGIWDKNVTLGQPQFGTSKIRVVSNTAAKSTTGTGGGSLYTLEPLETEDNQGEWETYYTMSTKGDCMADLADGNAGAANMKGVTVGYRETALRAFNAKGAVAMGATYFGETVGDIPHPGGATVWGPRANGTKFGVQALHLGASGELEHHLWMDEGSGWEWVGALIRTDVELVGGGHSGLAFMGDVNTRVDDFGAGILERFIPKIIRRPPDPGGVRDGEWP